jgi:hypothetical protein
MSESVNSGGNQRARIGSASPQSSDVGGAHRYCGFVPQAAISRMLLDHVLGAQQKRGGVVRPIAFAILRLRTNSNFVGRSIGRSGGLVPVKS